MNDLRVSDAVIIQFGSGSINLSNPIGSYAATHNLGGDGLLLDFTTPVDYVGWCDIDHVSATVDVTFVGGGTDSFLLDGTLASGDSAEFFGSIATTRIRL